MEKKHIKKYIALNNKTVTNEQLKRHLASLEKDLKDNDSKTLKRIQNNLKELIKYNQTIIVEIEPTALKEYKQILSVDPSKKVISDFIAIQGSSNKTKARSLLKEVETVLTNSQLANRDYYLKIQTVLTP